MKKEIVESKISLEALRALDESKVMAIAFGELGAQFGSEGFIAVISDLENSVSIIKGKAGFQSLGESFKSYEGDIDINVLENSVPFMKRFIGDSVEAFQRGHFIMDNEWVHLDAIFGNHFFIRGCHLAEFLKRLNKRFIAEAAIDVMKEILNNSTEVNMEAQNGMIGAIVGDIAGSRFEFRNIKTKDFELLVRAEDVERSRAEGWKDRKKAHEECKRNWFQRLFWRKKNNLGKMLAEGGSLLSSSIDVDSDGRESTCRCNERSCFFTDESIMTLAVADAIMKWRYAGTEDYGELSNIAVSSMRDFGKRYPRVSYGHAFNHWLHNDNPHPYNSWGNGAAMRVSACGWAGRTLYEVKEMARAVTVVTHSHPEGIIGAEATAVAIFLARTGASMDLIRGFIVRNYYPLCFSLDEIRPYYEFDTTCQGTVPQALQAFFESTSFEDAIRNAISIGGDSDTIAAITGAVAGAYYGVPRDIRAKAETFLTSDLLGTLFKFERMFE